jgi:uncharacterized protein (TIGR03067 family)
MLRLRRPLGKSPTNRTGIVTKLSVSGFDLGSTWARPPIPVSSRYIDCKMSCSVFAFVSGARVRVMDRFAIAVFSSGVVALLLVASAAADDLEKMQGQWEGTTAKKQHVTLVIKKNHIAMNGERDGIPSSSECEFKLDETQNPKTLDFGKMRIFVGKERKEDLNVIDLPMPAIYRLEGEHFDLYIGFGEERPKGFPEKLPTTGCTRFTRVADKPAGSKAPPTNQK